MDILDQPRHNFTVGTIEFSNTSHNRTSLELLFNRCLECIKRRPECTCHEDGKGRE